jgi:hypothetical protein
MQPPLPSCIVGGAWAGPCQWPSSPPPDCPFPPSATLAGVAFSGTYGAYPSTSADTWYPSLAADGRLLTSFADGTVCTSSAPSPSPPPPPPLPPSLVALEWWWSEARSDNVLSTASSPPDPADGSYELVGTIGYASSSPSGSSSSSSPPSGSCELQLFRAPTGTREYWTVCGPDEAAEATAAGYGLVASLGAYLPSSAPPVGPAPVPPSVATNMPAGETSGWASTSQLYSAARGDHYATPEHFLPDGYEQLRQQGFMRIELPPQQTCVTASGANAGVQGVAVLEGDSPFNLTVAAVAAVPHPPFTANVSFPGEVGLYPSTSFTFNGSWVFGYYLLADPSGAGCGNWCHLGPLVAFGVASVVGAADGGEASGGDGGGGAPDAAAGRLAGRLDLNWSWAGSPYWGGNDASSSSSSPSGVFEPLDVTRPIRMGVPRFVDLGANLEHSPDGRAYLIAKGCSANDGTHCSFMTGDAAYLARTVSPLSAFGGRLTDLNLASSWEFFAGGGEEGGGPLTASWAALLADAQPLFSWPTGIGGLTMTFNPVLGKFFVVNNLPGDRIHPTDCSFDTAVLEADSITGPFSLVSYMRSLGPQMYFQQLSSKFWSADGLTGALFSSGNWDGACVTQGSNPPGERYGMVTTEMSFVPRAAAASEGGGRGARVE